MNSCLSFVGGLFLTYHGVRFGLQIIQGIRTFIIPSLGFRRDLKSFGSWAVVTGSTDGIGKSYAKMLAKQGINIVLMSRNMEKLQRVETEIRSEYNVQTRIIVIDFSGSHEIYQQMGDKLNDLEIGILVNNVGLGTSCPDDFHKHPCKDHYSMININILSVVMMSYVILPIMVARKKGLIINVSSICGLLPMPLLATYSASKAFVDFFSRCLNREYSDKGIMVQCVMPGFVSTNMTKQMPTNPLVPSADHFVHQAWGTIGKEPRTCGYWSHSLKVWLALNVFPDWLKDVIVWKLWSGLRADIHRHRRLKKEQQNAKSGHND